jgi:hypothetical protein
METGCAQGGQLQLGLGKAEGDGIEKVSRWIEMAIPTSRAFGRHGGSVLERVADVRREAGNGRMPASARISHMEAAQEETMGVKDREMDEVRSGGIGGGEKRMVGEVGEAAWAEGEGRIG